MAVTHGIYHQACEACGHCALQEPFQATIQASLPPSPLPYPSPLLDLSTLHPCGLAAWYAVAYSAGKGSEETWNHPWTASPAL